MRTPRADEAERHVVLDAWSVVRVYWAELRRVGWTCAWVELYAYDWEDDASSYASHIQVDFYLQGMPEEGRVVWIYQDGALREHRHDTRWWLAEMLAMLLRGHRGFPSEERPTWSPEVTVEPEGILRLLEHADDSQLRELASELSDRGPYQRWHTRQGILLAADMLLGELIDHGLSPTTLEPDEKGLAIWDALLALPIFGMPTAEEDPTDWGRGP